MPSGTGGRPPDLIFPFFLPINASLMFASAYVLTFLVLAWIMYRNKIFIKI